MGVKKVLGRVSVRMLSDLAYRKFTLRSRHLPWTSDLPTYHINYFDLLGSNPIGVRIFHISIYTYYILGHMGTWSYYN